MVDEGCHYLIGSLGSTDKLRLVLESGLKNRVLQDRIKAWNPHKPAGLRRCEMSLDRLVGFQARTRFNEVFEAQTVYSILNLEA